MKNLVQFTLLIVCMVFISCEKNPKQPGYEVKILTDMVYPIPYEPYSKNPNYKNGRTNQHPVKGTIYRGGLIGKSDVEANAKNILRGKEVYGNYCLICHGSNGDGDGPLIPKFPNPPTFTSRRVMKLTTEQLYKVVTEGKGDMKSHAGQIGLKDRWKVVYFVEQLQGKRK